MSRSGQSFDNETEMSSQTYLYGVCARAALLFAAFVALSTILACSSVYLAAASPSSTLEQPNKDASTVQVGYFKGPGRVTFFFAFLYCGQNYYGKK